MSSASDRLVTAQMAACVRLRARILRRILTLSVLRGDYSIQDRKTSAVQPPYSPGIPLLLSSKLRAVHANTRRCRPVSCGSEAARLDGVASASTCKICRKRDVDCPQRLTAGWHSIGRGFQDQQRIRPRVWRREGLHTGIGKVANFHRLPGSRIDPERIDAPTGRELIHADGDRRLAAE